MKRLLVPLLAAVLGAALFSGLLFIDFYRSLDSRLYDLMLHIKPGIDEDESILLLEVDDQVIAQVNQYPLPREIFADGLILMKEFEPAWTLLDIEFVDGSVDAVDQVYLNQGIVEDINRAFEEITFYQRSLVEGVLDGSISRRDVPSFLNDLEDSSWDAANTLYQDFGKVTFSRDEYLGRAVAYVGDISVTVNMHDEKDITDSDKTIGSIKAAARELAREKVSISDSLTLEANPLDDESVVEIQPSIYPVLDSAAWAGFPRMHIDPDGVRRRIDVLMEHDGYFYTHIGFGTWWFREGRPPITVRKDSLLVGNTVIPLDRDGKMLINYPKRTYIGTPLGKEDMAREEGFDPDFRLSFFFLYYHDELMASLSDIIAELEAYGVASDVYGDSAQSLSRFESDLDRMRQAMLETGDGSRAGEFGRYRDEFLAEAGRFFASDAENNALWDLEDLLGDPEVTDEDYAFYADAYESIPVLFEEAGYLVEDLANYREYLRSKLSGATVVVGYTGTSTTDYGANPFERKYMNMGIYGAVYNSLLQGEFLREIPLWMISIITLGVGLITALLSNVSRKRSSVNTIVGALFIVAALAAAGTVFVFTGIYVNLLPILLALLTVYVASMIVSFLAASRDKALIQDQFGRIISPEIVKEIQEDPETLNVTGKNQIITAMFTDIEAFSTISEHLKTPDRIIEFLKRYLTPMSDIILDERGTIDKYEGDAIIAFWNAPLEQERHHFHACHAAMRMVEMEKKIHRDLYDEGFLDDELIAKLMKRPGGHPYLFTRIGINTGLNNVGFIGTEKRKDYTALGDEMNLAARLEGVNKIYGTQVLISDTTKQHVSEEFYTRRLDKVRVMGKSEPVQLHQLSFSKRIGGWTEEARQCFIDYQAGLDLFYAQNWDESEALFAKVLEINPDDGPSRVFIDRCKKYRRKSPPKDWDGVYDMKVK